MENVAKIFGNGGSQAVRLPRQFRFDDDEVFVKKVGKSIMLIPKSEDAAWNTFLDGLNSFTDDIFEDERNQGNQKERESL